jgi:excisionase family DNA binding protein
LIDRAYVDQVEAMSRAGDRIRSVSGPEFRTSVPVAEESVPSVDQLPQEITVREATALLGCTDRHVRRLITAGEIPILRRKPIMLSRDAVIAYQIRRDTERSSAA